MVLKKWAERKEEIRDMYYVYDLTLEEIGERLGGISKQRVKEIMDELGIPRSMKGIFRAKEK